MLWRTTFGLRLRSCGESPTAAETLGVNVYRYKFIAVILRRAGRGGGAYLATVSSSGYQNGQTLGLGYIGLAAMIFGNWRPSGLFLGSLLFGYTLAARLRSGGESVHALLLLVAVGLVAAAIWQLRKRSGSSAGGRRRGWPRFGLVLLCPRVPGDFTEMTPYIATLLVLALASQSFGCRPPTGSPIARARPADVSAMASTGTRSRQRPSRRWAMPTRRTPGSRSVLPPWLTTGAWSPGATSRTRPTASACAPNAAWSPSCISAVAAD